MTDHVSERAAREPESIIYELEAIQESIAQEYSLNDQRLGALVIVNAVLFGFLGVMVSETDALVGKANTMGIGLSLTGVLVSLLAGLSLIAGVAQIDDLKKRREELHKHADSAIPFAVIGAKRLHWKDILGRAPYVFYPWGLVLVWLWLMRSLFDWSGA